MTLRPGTRLGVYEITGPIGQGGMGQVFRARDTKLDRDVAIKVLPEVFAHDADRVARFTREAKTLASLNHPHIAGVHGLEETGGVAALVMELVEGEDLSTRISRGALPVGEALAIATQIADALEAAHEHGIVHRDLKPANIKVREDGTVKVLDFGLAKAVGGDPAATSDLTSAITSPAMTNVGMILGTAAYMSPEQARGKPVDRRADIWAFGCVFYEMVTGTRAFAGDETSDVLASVLAREPEWTRVPPSCVRLLKKCLEKDPRKRLRHIGDWELLVDQTPVRTNAPSPRRALEWLWPVATIAAIAAAMAIAVVAWRAKPAPADAPRFRMTPQLPPTVAALAGPDIVISPDGTRAAIFARGATEAPSTQPRIWIWAFDSGTATPIAGSEGAPMPFWSPDSRYLAIFKDKALTRFDVFGGGALQTISTNVRERNAGVGGAWSKNNVILFAGASGGLSRMPADGGTPTPVTALTPGELHHELPEFLPDGRHFLYLRHTVDTGRMAIFLGDVEAVPDAQPQKPLIAADDGVHYLESPNAKEGFLLFAKAGVLLAHAFDPVALELRGSAITMATDISAGDGTGAISASRSGSLIAYGTGFTTTGLTSNLVWVDRSGKETPLPLRPHNYQYPRVSPDGKRLAVVQESERRGENDLWVYNLETGAALRLTHEASNGLPVWSGNGERIVFSSTRDLKASEGPRQGVWGNLYSVRSDGSGGVERLTTAETSQALSGISANGRQLFYTNTITIANHWEMTRVDLDNGGALTPLLPGPFRRSSAELSPDGGLMSYRSDDTGSFEIYVQTYPAFDAKVPVSVGGGDSPIWSADGKELFYRSGNRVMAVEVTHQPTLRATSPRELFSGEYRQTGAGGRQYHVGPDGRFVMLKPLASSQAQARLVLDINWLASRPGR